jgi:1,2-phenylacetyl-CoA epoxidase PaaB subunit
METVDVRSKAGLAQIVGTLASVGGATLRCGLTHSTSSVQEHITARHQQQQMDAALGAAAGEAHQEVSFSHLQHCIYGLVQLRSTFTRHQRHFSMWLLRGTTQIATVLFTVRKIAQITNNLQRINKSPCYRKTKNTSLLFS